MNLRSRSFWWRGADRQGMSSLRLLALTESCRCHHLHRSLVDGGATRGRAQQELPARRGGGATGDHGGSRDTGAAVWPGPQLPTLAWWHWELMDSAQAPGTALAQLVESWTGLDGACLLLRDLCSSIPLAPSGCPAWTGGPGLAWVVQDIFSSPGELRCQRFTVSWLGTSGIWAVSMASLPTEAKGLCHTTLHKVYTTIY